MSSARVLAVQVALSFEMIVSKAVAIGCAAVSLRNTPTRFPSAFSLSSSRASSMRDWEMLRRFAAISSWLGLMSSMSAPSAVPLPKKLPSLPKADEVKTLVESPVTAISLGAAIFRDSWEEEDGCNGGWGW